MIFRLQVAGALALAILVALAGPATAIVVEGDGDGLNLTNQARAAYSGRHAAIAAAAAANPYIVVGIPDCPGNNINAGVDAPCQRAVDACPPGEVMMQFHRGLSTMTIGQPGWVHLFTTCAAQPAAGEPAIFPGVTLDDFQRLPLPAGASTVEPPGGNVLIRMPTNAYASDLEPVMLNTVTLGQPVQVRATPVRWSWDFGDGAVVGPTQDPGGPYPELTNTHEYTARGSYDITMTTYYAGEYSLDGATWLPIVGEAQVPGPPTTVVALAGRNELVAGTNS